MEEEQGRGKGRGQGGRRGGGSGHTDFGGAVHFEDVDAFGDGGAGVVDDIEHGLGGVVSLCMGRAGVAVGVPLVESWWRLGCGWRRLLSLVS